MVARHSPRGCAIADRPTAPPARPPCASPSRSSGSGRRGAAPRWGVVLGIEGLQHGRATPQIFSDTDPHTWLGLATGTLDPATAAGEGRLRVSGTRADLTAHLPLFDDLEKGT